MEERLSYKKAGVDIDAAEALKRRMAKPLEADDPRVLNRLGAFASLFDARFASYQHPVLVLKMEEPGSKQKLAAQYGRVASIAYELIRKNVLLPVADGDNLSFSDLVLVRRLHPVAKELLAEPEKGVCLRAPRGRRGLCTARVVQARVSWNEHWLPTGLAVSDPIDLCLVVTSPVGSPARVV